MILRDLAPDEFPDDSGDEIDFGLHYPAAYVHRVVTFLRLSNWSFWPQAGGLDDQDSFLIDDVLTWVHIESKLKEARKADRAWAAHRGTEQTFP